MNDALPPDLDDELRAALREEADRATSPADAWARLDERLAGDRAARRRGTTKALIGVAAAAAVAAAAIGVWQVRPEDSLQVDVTGDGTTTAATTAAATTVAPPTAPSTTPSTAPAPTTGATILPTTPSTAPAAGSLGALVAVTVDGRLVVVDVASGRELRELAALGDPRVEPVEGPGPNVITDVAVTPDGRRVFFDSCCEPAVGTIFEVPADGSREAEPIAMGTGPAVSPDGTKLAYTAIDSVVVRDLTTGEERTYPDPRATENPLAGQLTWSLDGKRVYYVHTRWGAPTGPVSALVELDLAAERAPRTVAEVTNEVFELPLALDDGRTVSVFRRAVNAGGALGAQLGERFVDTMTGATRDGSDTGVADRVWRPGGAPLYVLEDGRIVSGDRVVATGYRAATW
jgi:hypothetical protein